MNIIKKIIYQYGIPILGRLTVSKNKYCNVIYYHDIVSEGGHSYMQTDIELFKRQMLYLIQNGFETMRFDDFEELKSFAFRKKRVMIAFDDGWVSNYTEIFNWMKERGLKYNVFLAAGLIGNDSQHLTWDMVRTMHRSGLCGFGTHTFSHVDVSKLTKQVFDNEIKKADTVFEQELGYSPKDFCYPFGKYSESSNQILVEQSQYHRIYLSSMSYSYSQSGRYIMGRNGISNDEPFMIFKNKAKGYYNIFSSIIS